MPDFCHFTKDNGRKKLLQIKHGQTWTKLREGTTNKKSQGRETNNEWKGKRIVSALMFYDFGCGHEEECVNGCFDNQNKSRS